MEAGPVVTIGYHLYGCTSFFLYSWQHRDIRRAIMYAFALYCSTSIFLFCNHFYCALLKRMCNCV